MGEGEKRRRHLSTNKTQRRQHLLIFLLLVVLLFVYAFWYRISYIPSFNYSTLIQSLKTIADRSYAYKDNITNRKAAYKNKLVILALGDSLTQGLHNWPTSMKFHPYTLKLSRLLENSLNDTHVTVLNRGVSGDTVTKVKDRLLVYFSNNTGTNMAVILAGTNDYSQIIKRSRDTGVLQQADRLKEAARNVSHAIIGLHQECHRRHVDTVVVTLPEIKYERYDNTDVSARLRGAVNRRLRRYARKHKKNTIIANLASYLDKLGTDGNEYARIWDDGVHLTPYGYDRMGSYIYRKISKYLIEHYVKTS